MKNHILATVVALLTCFASDLNARIVTLTVGGSKTNDSLTIEANEALTILTGEGNDYVTWEKDGFTFGTRSAGFWAQEFNPGIASIRSGRANIVTIAGPARINLGKWSNEEYVSYLTVEVRSEQFPPDKALVLPQGDGANIILESSTNLVHWSPAPVGSYTNKTANLFFRIRAERFQ